MTTQAIKKYGPKPPEFAGSEPEWIVFNALIDLGKQPGVDFSYQSRLLGGRVERGGFVIDFEIFNPPGLSINVQGIYFHYEQGQGVIQKDRLLREMLAAQGTTLIFIDEDDLNENPKYYVSEALRFKDHSFLGRGGV